MTSPTAIRRTGPPQAAQKVRDGVYLVQVSLSESPSADWRRLFYETRDMAPDFPPRSVEVTGALLRFRSDTESVAARIGWIDRWVAHANQKEAALGNRSEEQRRHREEQARDQAELAELNARWAKL